MACKLIIEETLKRYKGAAVVLGMSGLTSRANKGGWAVIF